MGQPIIIKLLQIINVVKYYFTTINISTCFVLWWTQMYESNLHFFSSNMSVFFLETFHFFPQKYHFQYWTMFNFRVSSENFCQFFEKPFWEGNWIRGLKKVPIDRKMRCVSFSRCRNGYENPFHKSDYFLFLWRHFFRLFFPFMIVKNSYLFILTSSHKVQRKQVRLNLCQM